MCVSFFFQRSKPTFSYPGTSSLSRKFQQNLSVSKWHIQPCLLLLWNRSLSCPLLLLLPRRYENCLCVVVLFCFVFRTCACPCLIYSGCIFFGLYLTSCLNGTPNSSQLEPSSKFKSCMRAAKQWKTLLKLDEVLSLFRFKPTRVKWKSSGWPNDTQLGASWKLGCSWLELAVPFCWGFQVNPFTPKSDQWQVPGLQPHQKYDTTQYEELGFFS